MNTIAQPAAATTAGASENAATQITPRWLQDIERLLPIRSQFILSGNIRDLFLTPGPNAARLAQLRDCLWAWLADHGFRCMLIHDRVDGITVHPNTEDNRRWISQHFKDLDLNSEGSAHGDLTTLAFHLRRAVTQREARVAVLIDYASRITASPQNLETAEQSFFVLCEKLAITAEPLQRAANPESEPVSYYNPVIWLLNRAQDLPSWYVLDCERVHSVEIGQPDFDQRLNAARAVIGRFDGTAAASPAERESAIRTFANATDGLSLQAMSDVSRLARHRRIPMAEIEDAIRCFKVGAMENPWRKDSLRDKIRGARDSLEGRVKGQHQAVTKTVDILIRSVMGLTGAQARSSSSRPRGVLFFAGPTGVGKTELAKSLTELLFGDEKAYIRFDMSEFAEEHASARLLGAPPGYVGYDAGGELTNAVRARPFSVILFDEIEKAHPRLLDKFLQILEDGRLTDGRGETIYFSEAIIIFTSNLGIYSTQPDGERVQNVTPEDSYDVVESRVRNAIGNYFKFQLERPEILNRIGDNVVVFNFIQPEVARAIFDGMLRNVVGRVQEEHELELEISNEARQQLLDLCTTDLANGGRGIGNRLETTFINPLARAMFQMPLADRHKLTVRGVINDNNIYTVAIE